VLLDQLHSGRTFGARRAGAGGWSPARRLLYAGGSALIVPLRLWRLLPLLSAPAPAGQPSVPRLLPALVGLLAVHTLGEATGYLLGPGGSPAVKNALEFHRERHVRAGDLATELGG
jgi:hypothetical protein